MNIYILYLCCIFNLETKCIKDVAFYHCVKFVKIFNIKGRIITSLFRLSHLSDFWFLCRFLYRPHNVAWWTWKCKTPALVPHCRSERLLHIKVVTHFSVSSHTSSLLDGTQCGLRASWTARESLIVPCLLDFCLGLLPIVKLSKVWERALNYSTGQVRLIDYWA